MSDICKKCLWQYNCSSEDNHMEYCRKFKYIPEGFSRIEDMVEVEWVRKALQEILNEKPLFDIGQLAIDYYKRRLELLLNGKELGGKG